MIALFPYQLQERQPGTMRLQPSLQDPELITELLLTHMLNDRPAENIIMK